MMPDLVAFLTARLDEHEAAAKAAYEAEKAGAYEDEPARWRSDGEAICVDGGHGWVPIAAGPWGAGISDEIAQHIIRWDPARVLAETAAKRKILELHVIGSRPEKWGDVRHHPGQDYPRTNYVGQPTGGTVYYCEVCDQNGSEYGRGEDEAFSPRALPGCETLLAMALPDADHADYNPVWRVDDDG